MGLFCNSRYIVTVISLVQIGFILWTASSLPGKGYSFIHWFLLAFQIAFLGYFCSYLFKLNKMCLKLIKVVIVIALYLGVGTGILMFSGEQDAFITNKADKNSTYNITLTNWLQWPLTIDRIFPVGTQGVQPAYIKHNDLRFDPHSLGIRYVISINYADTNVEIPPPKVLFIIYRAFQIIPLVSIIEL